MKTIAILILSLIGLQGLAQEEAYTLTMNINGLETTDGKVGIRLLNTSEEVVMRKMIDVTGANMTTTFENVVAGTYAVSYFHDANDNGELDFKWYGAPDEGTGNSNDVKGLFGPPDFEEQLIKIAGSMTVTMKTQYY